jgi:F-type H+-transporting ATPase subunit a
MMNTNLLLNLVITSASAEGGGGHPEIPNAITIVTKYILKNGPTHDFLHHYETQIYFVVILAIVSFGFAFLCRNLTKVPGRTQAAIELLFGGLYDFFSTIIGYKYARFYVPFIGSLFIFIWSMNMAGMVPGFKSPTASPITTFSLAICVFIVVQITGIFVLGPKKYIMHLLQDPEDIVGWMLCPLFFVLHVIGEIAKPISLALRLFGNVTGEDILAGVVLMLGVGMGTLTLFNIGNMNFAIGVPLHFPIFFLMILFGTIQALVFALLSAIYIMMFLPHEEHH